MNLSPSFTLEEMTASETAVRYGIDNTPDNEVLMNLRRLALFLEEVRAAIGMPIRINSAFRSVIMWCCSGYLYQSVALLCLSV